MNLGRLSSAALFVSGLAGVLLPQRVGAALDMPPTSTRGRAEARIGLGGTYAGLGAYALASGHPVAQRAVGATWLGAAATRAGTLRDEKVASDWTFWAYFAGEVGLGLAALLGSIRHQTDG